MITDLDKFVGRLPYDSQLVGIYQPLIGWRSRLIQNFATAAPIELPPFPKQVAASPHTGGPALFREPAAKKRRGALSPANLETCYAHVRDGEAGCRAKVPRVRAIRGRWLIDWLG